MNTRELEHIVRRAGLAVHLTDLATGLPVHDGITVTAWPSANPDLAVTTNHVSASGIAGFTHFPGLRIYEDGSTTRNDWFASPVQFAPVPFVVRVDDSTRDHLRVVREVLVPSPAPVDFALPRTPSAPVPSGSLTVVANVVSDAGGPAPYAVVDLSVGGFVTGGVADRRGGVVVPVPQAVPPTSAGTASGGPVWGLTVRVRYRAASQLAAPGAQADDPPTITSLLTQPFALIVDGGGPLVGDIARDLTTGGPLVLSSFLPSASSVLVVRPTP